MRSRWLCALALVSLAAAQARPAKQPPSAPPAEAPFKITGRVVNAVTGQALAEAEVGIGVSGKPEIVDGVMTGADGRFAFGNLAPGKYWLTAEHAGYPRQGYRQHEGYSVGIAVGPKVPAEEVEFRLEPGSSVEGTVTDEQGDAVRRAKVMLFHSTVSGGARQTQFHFEAETDDQGRYLFGQLVPGRYFIAVHAEPWYTADQLGTAGKIAVRRYYASRDGRPTVAAEAVSELSPQLSGSSLDVLYPVTYYANSNDTVSATPIDVKGGERATADVVLQPVPAVHFRFRCATCGADVGSAAVAQQSFGSYEIPVGRPSLEVLGQDGQEFVVPPGPIVIRAGPRELTIEATEGLSVDGQNASASAQVSGRVLLDDGTALKEPSGAQFMNTVTGESVGANITGEKLVPVFLKPGTYSVYIPGRGDFLVKSIAATGAKAAGQSIEVAEGAQVHLEITLTKGSVDVIGTATRDGRPVAGAMVLLVPQDMEHNEALIRRDESDSDGTFLLRATLPGKYTLLAIENGWDLEWKKAEVLEPYLKAGQAVVVKAGGKYDLKVTVQ